jgi:hypothetical protein
LCHPEYPDMAWIHQYHECVPSGNTPPFHRLPWDRGNSSIGGNTGPTVLGLEYS